MANNHLERHGHEARIDRRTLEEQGIDREPTMHRGPQVDAIERRGIETDHTRENAASTMELAGLRAALSNITRDIAALQNEQKNEVAAAMDLPQPANKNEIGIDLSPAANTLEKAPVEAVNFLNDKPTPPPTKDIAEEMRIAAAAERRARTERMLLDRNYRNEQETRDREERERLARQRDEEYQRAQE
jgi:hypothetical protein